MKRKRIKMCVKRALVSYLVKFDEKLCDRGLPLRDTTKMYK